MRRGSVVGGEGLVEGDGEGEEFFAGGGVDHLDVDLSAFQGGDVGVVVDVLDVVEEVAGEGGVWGYGGGLEAEVVVVLDDLFVDGGVVDGNVGEGDLGSHGLFGGEEAAVEVVESGGGELVVVGGDELHADFVKVERGVGVVGDDDADGDEGVAYVGEAEEVAIVGTGAGIDGDGDVIVGVGVEGGVLIRGAHWRSFFAGGKGGRGGKAGGEQYEKNGLQDADLVGLHGQVDYDLRWRGW
jgi:hypothetical protein